MSEKKQEQMEIINNLLNESSSVLCQSHLRRLRYEDLLWLESALKKQFLALLCDFNNARIELGVASNFDQTAIERWLKDKINNQFEPWSAYFQRKLP